MWVIARCSSPIHPNFSLSQLFDPHSQAIFVSWPISETNFRKTFRSVLMPWRKFIGSSGTFTFQQRQIDIEFNQNGIFPNRRLVHISLGQGLGFLYTETQALLGAAWVAAPAQGLVVVHDYGAAGLPAALAPIMVPASNVIINGVQWGPVGFPMIWFRQLQGMRVNVPLAVMHTFHFIYKPHKQGEPGEEMVPDLNKQPELFTRIHCGGQIQNWRQIE